LIKQEGGDAVDALKEVGREKEDRNDDSSDYEDEVEILKEVKKLPPPTVDLEEEPEFNLAHSERAEDIVSFLDFMK